MADTKQYFEYTKARDLGWSHEAIEKYVAEQQEKGVPLYIKNEEYKGYTQLKENQNIQAQIQNKKDEGFWNNFANKSDTALGWLNDSLLSPFMRELQRPFVSVYSGITGKKGAVKTPFGEVKPYTEQTQGERVGSIVELGSSVIPVGKIYRGVKKVVSKIPEIPGIKQVSEALPMERLASFLSNVPKEKFLFAKQNPELVKAGQEFIEQGEESLPEFGQKIFTKAKTVRKAGIKAYGEQELKLIEKNKQAIFQNRNVLKSSLNDILAPEKIKMQKDKIDLIGSTFEGDTLAQKVFNDITKLTSRKIQNAEDLITRREAISNIIKKIPREELNLKRVAGTFLDKVDDNFNVLTNNAFSTLKSNYKMTSGNALDIIKGMSDKYGTFKPDKAKNYVTQLFSEIKFDKKKSVKVLDSVAGTNFVNEAKAIGVARAIDNLEPITSGRVFDVLKTYGLAKIPILSAIVSPKFWGEVFLRQGSKQATKKITQEVQKNLLKQLFDSTKLNYTQPVLLNAVRKFFGNETE